MAQAALLFLHLFQQKNPPWSLSPRHFVSPSSHHAGVVFWSFSFSNVPLEILKQKLERKGKELLWAFKTIFVCFLGFAAVLEVWGRSQRIRDGAKGTSRRGAPRSAGARYPGINSLIGWRKIVVVKKLIKGLIGQTHWWGWSIARGGESLENHGTSFPRSSHHTESRHSNTVQESSSEAFSHTEVACFPLSFFFLIKKPLCSSFQEKLDVWPRCSWNTFLHNFASLLTKTHLKNRACKNFYQSIEEKVPVSRCSVRKIAEMLKFGENIWLRAKGKF